MIQYSHNNVSPTFWLLDSFPILPPISLDFFPQTPGQTLDFMITDNIIITIYSWCPTLQLSLAILHLNTSSSLETSHHLHPNTSLAMISWLSEDQQTLHSTLLSTTSFLMIAVHSVLSLESLDSFVTIFITLLHSFSVILSFFLQNIDLEEKYSD